MKHLFGFTDVGVPECNFQNIRWHGLMQPTVTSGTNFRLSLAEAFSGRPRTYNVVHKPTTLLMHKFSATLENFDHACAI